MAGDSYRTVAAPAEAACRERSSKFLSWIYPVRTEEEIRERLDALRKRYYDATHHCYAWRLGPRGEAFRANDDGEPSGTAGKPILGQLLSNDITDCLVVVVRYFGSANGSTRCANGITTPRTTVTPGGWDPAARRSAPTTTGNPRERPENRSSDNCSRTTSRTAWWSWSATSAARNWGFRG